MKIYIFYAILTAIATGFVSCNDDEVEQISVPPRNIKSYDLSGNVKSVETITYQNSYNAEILENKIVSEKTVRSFDKNGVETGAEFFSSRFMNTALYLNDLYTYKFDSKYRITDYFYESYSYPDYEKQELYDGLKMQRVFDDSKKKVTETRYEYSYNYLTNKKEYHLKSVYVYDLNKYGNINWSSYIGQEFETRNTADTPIKIDSKKQRVVLAKDDKGNWTEGYIKEEEFDLEGKVSYTRISNYQKRIITYY